MQSEDYHPDDWQDPAEVREEQRRETLRLRTQITGLTAVLLVTDRADKTSLRAENTTLRAQLAAVSPLSLPLSPSEERALSVDTLTPPPPDRLTRRSAAASVTLTSVHILP